MWNITDENLKNLQKVGYSRHTINYSCCYLRPFFISKIVSINASYLIKNDYLVRPYIFFEPVHDNTSYHSYAKVYENCIVKNNDFNNHVAETANHLISQDQSTLVLVQQYPQGDYLLRLLG